MSTSPDLHGMSDAACVAFSRLVACNAPGCDGGDVDGEPCERCGGEGRVMPPAPTLPAMPPRSVAIVRGWWASRPALAIRPAEPTFWVRRFDDLTGETDYVEVWGDELSPDEIARMPEEERALAETWRDVADVRDADPVHNVEPAPETMVECAAHAAE